MYFFILPWFEQQNMCVGNLGDKKSKDARDVCVYVVKGDVEIPFHVLL